jgi:hypothetical protein
MASRCAGLLVFGVLAIAGGAPAGADSAPATPVPFRGATSPGVPAPAEAGAPAGELEAALQEAAPTLRPEALHAALQAWRDLVGKKEVARQRLTVIDYSLPSTTPRLWVFDLPSRRLLFHERVAHGRNSGEDLATSFSNEEGSLMTSLGAFVTGAVYLGKNGYSLRLLGMDPGRNDHAEARAIVMHGAAYVSDEFVRRAGRLGRSLGCPAVRATVARALIDRVKGRSLLYAWHPSLASAF